MLQKSEIEKKYHGIVPAFYTCYEEDGSISESRNRALVRHLKNSGVQGLYVGGSSGECIYLSVSERKKLLEIVCDEAGSELFIIAHVACNNTQDSMELASHAESLGVSAIAAIPPIYFHLPEKSIAAYWNDISSAAPNTDFFIYNIPQLAGVSLTPSLYREMLQNPKVAGIKNSSMPVMDIERFKNIATDKVIWNGPDEQLLAGLSMGASGGIGGTYAVMPKLYLRIFQDVKCGKIEEASRLQTIATNIITKMVSSSGNMYAVAKKIISLQIGEDLGTVRAPLSNITEDDMNLVKEIVDDIANCYQDYSL